ncbi:hypothetical protein V3N99_17165 [Dermatophilaceae bacterium Soc4.6]
MSSSSPSSSPVAAPTPALRVLQVVVGGMTSGIVLIGVAFALILPLAAPPLMAVLAVVVVAAAMHLLIERVGYRVAPLAASEPVAQTHQQAQAAFQRLLFVRAVLAETPALIGIVVAFAWSPSSWFTYAVGAVLAVALVARHAWPTARSVDRVVVALEADGTGSGIREVLGLTAAQPGRTGSGDVTESG